MEDDFQGIETSAHIDGLEIKFEPLCDSFSGSPDHGFSNGTEPLDQKVTFSPNTTTLKINALPDFQEVMPEVFRNAVIRAAETSELHANNLDIMESYEGYSCWLDRDGKAGFAVSSGGILTNVFATESGFGGKIMDFALNKVGPIFDSIRLTCFDGYLANFYGSHGFAVKEREPNYNGENQPDVLHMEYVCGK